jgi:hypothetical protein
VETRLVEIIQMPRLRSRCAALALALALALSPLATAAPKVPGGDSWWSTLAGLFDLFDVFGLDDVRTITAPEGPALEPDGLMLTSDPEGSDDFTLTEEEEEPRGGGGAKAPTR